MTDDTNQKATIVSEESFDKSQDKPDETPSSPVIANPTPVIARSEATKQSQNQKKIATSLNSLGTRNDTSSATQEEPKLPAPEPEPTEKPSEPQQNSNPPEEEKGEEKSEEKPAETTITQTPQKDIKGARLTGPAAPAAGGQAHWYVVHTYSGHEAKVAATLKQRIESQKLQDKIFDILVPTQEKIEIKEGKKSTVKEKIFPGYILIRMILDDNTWLAVRTTPGITSFVGNANKPTPLPEEEVTGIKRFMAMEAPKFKTTFSPGEAVKITDGPFSDFLGTIDEIDEEKGKVKVLVSIFGRETPVELDLLQIAKV